MFPEANRLLLVDGHAYAYRSFHAIRSLSAPDGSPTNAIYGFIKTLGKLRSRLQPQYLAVAWDGGLAAERLSALPEYKAQRPPMPEPLAKQLDGMADYLTAVGLASVLKDGVEADDWIATATRQAVEQGANVIIASSDKDFMQLVSGQVGLFNPNDPTESIWTAVQVRERAGVEPVQVVDWLSLVGDTVDNIPGVRGVGPKTAAELLKQFGTIHALYQRLHEVKSEKQRDALREAEPLVRRNLDLIRLNDRVPGDFTLAAARLGAPDTVRLRELFTRWGFRGMLRDLAVEPARQAEQTELF